MNYILSVSFANEKVATRSYENLSETSADEQVIVLDNHYPIHRQNGRNWLRDLCDKLRFRYIDNGYNMGLYDGYNFLLTELPQDCKGVILHDGDHLINEEGWTKAIFDVLEDETVGNCIVSNAINYRELHERGFESAVINGHKVRVTKQVICSTVGGWSMPFLRAIGGITAPNKYYGGNEIHMWDHFRQQGKRMVVLEDFSEELDSMKALQDWQYEEYKLLYAHKGLRTSFADYLKMDPVQHGREALLKSIFG